MVSSNLEIRTLEELREYVHHTLCEFDELLPGAFAMTERILVRNREACGMYFCLHGPRSVKLSAIWETERNTILFYGPDGQRYHTTRLAPLRAEATAAAS